MSLDRNRTSTIISPTVQFHNPSPSHPHVPTDFGELDDIGTDALCTTFEHYDGLSHFSLIDCKTTCPEPPSLLFVSSHECPSPIFQDSDILLEAIPEFTGVSSGDNNDPTSFTSPLRPANPTECLVNASSCYSLEQSLLFADIRAVNKKPKPRSMVSRASKPKSRYAIRSKKTKNKLPRNYSKDLKLILSEARRKVRVWRASQQHQKRSVPSSCKGRTIPPVRAISSSHIDSHDQNISEHRVRNLDLYEYCQENVITRSRAVDKKLSRFAKSDFNVP